MNGLNHSEVTVFLLSIGVMLGMARALGELMRRFRQPAVLGEILAGLILGPTILGQLNPVASQYLFPMEGPVAVAREGLVTVGIVLFLLVAGMEVDLSTAFRQGKAALYVSFFGMVIPFAMGFGAAWFAPQLLMDVPEGRELIFALFFATALCISALPVIAKILLDLNLFKTDMGVVIVASAIINDLAGWLIFAVVLGMMSNASAAADAKMSVPTVIMMTLLFAAFSLTIGRWLLHKILPWFQAHLSWPAGVLGMAITMALLFGALTEWIGIHAIFGSFLFGIALGDTRHLRERTRATLDQFISTVFAPLFFASIGLKVNFVESFSLVPVLVVLVIATLGKVLGCTLGARLAGMNRQESWAVGYGMNARGAMEIILGLLALNAGVIDRPMFVALVIMALVTSMTSGTMMQRMLKRQTVVDFVDLLSPRSFSRSLKAKDRREAIRELAGVLASGTSMNPAEIDEAAWEREQTMPTGMGNGVAIPHARLKGLTSPLIAVGLSKEGLDFDSPDGSPAHVVFLILVPQEDNGAQLQILAGIAKMAQDRRMAERLTESEGFTEFLASLRAKEPEARPH